MLVLTREAGQEPYNSILIGPDIRVIIIQARGTKVRVGIEAPESVKIMREELVPPDRDGAGDGRGGGR
jgi:carbon storage regulator